MTDLILSFKNITLQKSGQTVLQGISFDLKKTEHWAFVGSSGSGKSLLLDFIAGRVSSSGGRAAYPFFAEYLDKHSVSDPLLRWQNLVAYVSSRHTFRSLSNINDLYYQQRFNSADSENVQTVQDYLSSIPVYGQAITWPFKKVVGRLRLIPLLNIQIIKLSNGETKRLLFAAALIKNPGILLLDNPFTGLDTDSRNDVDRLLTEIADSGISILIATSPTEIPRAITHVAVLANGKIKDQLPKSRFKGAMLNFSHVAAIDSQKLKNLLITKGYTIYETIVRMEDVTVRYGEKTILNNLNWAVGQGERWALLGPNGAGKSTLLSLIYGDNPQAYANKITLFDRRRGTGESIWDIKDKIGFVSPELFQYFPLESSCLQVVESGFYNTLGLFRLSQPNLASLSLQWMNLLSIGNLAGVPFENISASAQRLCLLARALVKNPILLILDEPCQGLDSVQREHFKYLLDEICLHSTVTLMYVTHYEIEIPSAVTHTIRLADGEIVSCS